jgi:hypothetical protein
MTAFIDSARKTVTGLRMDLPYPIEITYALVQHCLEFEKFFALMLCSF